MNALIRSAHFLQPPLGYMYVRSSCVLSLLVCRAPFPETLGALSELKQLRLENTKMAG